MVELIHSIGRMLKELKKKPGALKKKFSVLKKKNGGEASLKDDKTKSEKQKQRQKKKGLRAAADLSQSTLDTCCRHWHC